MTELSDMIENNKKIQAYLLMSNMYITMSELIYSKLEQIDRYDWLDKHDMKTLIDNLSSNFDEKINLVYEVQIGNSQNELINNRGKYFSYKTEEYGTINIHARIDAYDDKNLWEFKCVDSLSIEHKLQLILYAFIWENSMKEEFGSKIYKLLNVRTRELGVIKYNSKIIEEIVHIILEKKYGKQQIISDDEFIKKCNKLREKFLEGNNKIQVELTSEDYENEDEQDDNIYKKNMFI